VIRHLGPVLWCMLAGCAAQSLPSTFIAAERPAAKKVLSEILMAEPRQERAVMVGLTVQPQRLAAWDGSGTPLWEHDVDARSAPIIAGDFVVTQEAEGAVVRDLAYGRRVATVKQRAWLVGADGRGDRVIISLAYQAAKGPRGLLALVQGGKLRWTLDLKQGVGVPALVGDHVLVPWATHRLSVLSVDDGAELARWQYDAAVLGHVIAHRGHVYLGQHGLVRLHDKLFDGQTPAPPMLAPMKRELPGQPTWLRDGYATVPEPQDARLRVRVEWQLSTADQTVESDTLYLRAHRVLFAMEGGRDALRWAKIFEHDLIGAEVRADGLLVADTAGKVQLVTLDGERHTIRDLARPVTAMALRMGAQWKPPAHAASQAQPAPQEQEQEQAAPQDQAAPQEQGTPQEQAAENASPPLASQLYQVASLDDDRLGDTRRYAVERLARYAAPEITAQLMTLCSNRANPEPVVRSSCGRLGERDTGGGFVLEALQPPQPGASSATQVRIAALARAAANMGLSDAGPLLVARLEDLRTDTADLAPVIEALQKLDHSGAAVPLERFLRLHHAEPTGSKLHAAVEAAARALSKLDPKRARPTLELVASDRLAPQTAREAASKALADLDAREASE